MDHSRKIKGNKLPFEPRMIAHFVSCTPFYPEKPKGEIPQKINEMEIDKSTIVYSCSDCGAFVVREYLS